MSQHDAELEELTPADRDILDRQLHKKLMTSTGAFVPMILLAFGVIFYLNSTSSHGLDTRTITIFNVVLVLAGMLAAWLYVAHVINFFKDKNALQKKVYRGVITAKEGGMVQVNSHELKIGKRHYNALEKGMKVEIHLSMRSGIVIAVKRGS